MVHRHALLPKGINDRLMTLRIPLQYGRYVTIISAYAPTMTNPDEVKERFYSELNDVIHSTPSKDKIILMGDFNARVGCNYASWEKVIGHHVWEMKTQMAQCCSLCVVRMSLSSLTQCFNKQINTKLHDASTFQTLAFD